MCLDLPKHGKPNRNCLMAPQNKLQFWSLGTSLFSLWNVGPWHHDLPSIPVAFSRPRALVWVPTSVGASGGLKRLKPFRGLGWQTRVILEGLSLEMESKNIKKLVIKNLSGPKLSIIQQVSTKIRNHFLCVFGGELISPVLTPNMWVLLNGDSLEHVCWSFADHVTRCQLPKTTFPRYK